MNITIDSRAFKIIMDKLSFLEACMKAQNARQGMTKYMSEEDVMQVTNLKKDALYKKRKAGVLRASSVTGRKINYLRSDVEAYMNGCPRPSVLQPENQIKKTA